MKRLLIILTLFITITPYTHANITPFGQVKNCFTGSFKSYNTWLSLLSEKKKKFNQERFKKRFPQSRFDQVKKEVECIDFQYQVDGITVAGYMMKPRTSDTKKLPVIINNRGGNGSYGYVVFGRKMDYLADLAMAGYLVIGSQYRGSNRRIKNNGYDEFGGSDIADVVKLIDIVKTLPEANPASIALMGWSRGAMQSFLAAKQIPHLKTIVAIAGNSDMTKAAAWRPEMEKIYSKRMPNYQQNKAEELNKRSVINWFDKLPNKLPILLIHGDKDKRVNVEQSQSFSALLNANNHPNELIIYPNGNHGLTKHRKQLIEELIQWFDQHLS